MLSDRLWTGLEPKWQQALSSTYVLILYPYRIYRVLLLRVRFAHPREYTHIWNICTRIIGGRYMRRPFTPAHSYLLSTSSASLSTLFSFLSYELGSERSSTSRTLREGAIDIYRMLSHDDHRYDRELCFAIVLRPSPICRYRSVPLSLMVR